MSIDVEYAIKKDIRNNPIVREVDHAAAARVPAHAVARGRARRRCCSSRRGSTSSCCSTATRSSAAAGARRRGETINRQLRLEIETLHAPQRIEKRARQRAAPGGARRRPTRSCIERVPARRRRRAKSIVRRGLGDEVQARDSTHVQTTRAARRGLRSAVAAGDQAPRRLSSLTALALWAARRSRRGSSTCRSSSTTTTCAAARQQQRSTVTLAGEARRHRRSPRPGARVQRRRRHDLRRSDRDRRSGEDRGAALRALARLLRRRTEPTSSRNCPRKGRFAYAAPLALGLERAARARCRRSTLRGVGVHDGARGATTRTASWPRTCSGYVGARQRRARRASSSATTDQIRGQPGQC